MDKRCLLKKLSFVTLGTLILSFGIYTFYYQNNITEGGVLGILLILKNVFNMDVSISNILIDGVLILLGFKVLGKIFFGFTLYASFIFSITYSIFEKIGFLITINNNLIAAILGGLFVGVGCVIIMNEGAASGGDDCLAIVLSKICHFKIGMVYLVIDVSVLLISLIWLPVDKMVYSIVAVIISGQTINILFEKRNKKITSKTNMSNSYSNNPTTVQ